MRYEAPESVEAAVALLAQGNGSAKVLAGGTDLLVQLRSGRVKPEIVVDVKRIPELRQVSTVDGGFCVGAAVAGAELDEHEDVIFTLFNPFTDREIHTFNVLVNRFLEHLNENFIDGS